jgi:chromosome segregation ATPase
MFSLLLWWVLGYGIFYFKYEHRGLIDELKENFSRIKEENEHFQLDLKEYTEQNKILKAKAQQLLDQNQDYVKIVSELSRYSYILQKSQEKVQELQTLLSTYDTDITKKIDKITSTPLYTPNLQDWAEKKFF